MKAKKIKNTSTILLLPGTFCRNLAIQSHSKPGKLDQFYSQKSFICAKIIFFSSKMQQSAQLKKHCRLHPKEKNPMRKGTLPSLLNRYIFLVPVLEH
jgi:hypothetical protein